MKKFMILDLQWFAEAGTLVNTTLGYRNAYTGDLTSFDGTYNLSSLNKTYYDTTLLHRRIYCHRWRGCGRRPRRWRRCRPCCRTPSTGH